MVFPGTSLLPWEFELRTRREVPAVGFHRTRACRASSVSVVGVFAAVWMVRTSGVLRPSRFGAHPPLPSVFLFASSSSRWFGYLPLGAPRSRDTRYVVRPGGIACSCWTQGEKEWDDKSSTWWVSAADTANTQVSGLLRYRWRPFFDGCSPSGLNRLTPILGQDVCVCVWVFSTRLFGSVRVCISRVVAVLRAPRSEG